MSLDLSVHDKAVLNCIFNPSLPITEAYEDEQIEELIDDESSFLNAKELENVKTQEVNAIKAAEHEEYQQAIDILTECIGILPEKASLYNNRAQIYQFVGKFDDALDDLTKAISLGTKRNQRKTFCNALCQRGLLHRKYQRIELARQDYEKAAEFGSKFAKTQLVEINPYAALCNQMLKQVMQDLN